MPQPPVVQLVYFVWLDKSIISEWWLFCTILMLGMNFWKRPLLFQKKTTKKDQALYIYIKVIFETSSIQVSLDLVYGKLHIFLCGDKHGRCSQEKPQLKKRGKKDPSARKCRFLLWLLQCHPWLGSRCRILPILHPSTSQFSTCFQLLQDYSYVSINKDCFTYFHLEKSFKLVGNL